MRTLRVSCEEVTCTGCGAVHWPAQSVTIDVTDAEAEALGDLSGVQFLVHGDGQSYEFRRDDTKEIVLKGVLAKPLISTGIVDGSGTFREMKKAGPTKR